MWRLSVCLKICFVYQPGSGQIDGDLAPTVEHLRDTLRCVGGDKQFTDLRDMLEGVRVFPIIRGAGKRLLWPSNQGLVCRSNESNCSGPANKA